MADTDDSNPTHRTAPRTVNRIEGKVTLTAEQRDELVAQLAELAKANDEQRLQLNAKLKDLARGIFNPATGLDLVAAEGPHSSHYDNDGWF